MTKLRGYDRTWIKRCLPAIVLLLLVSRMSSYAQYSLQIIPVDRDSTKPVRSLGLTTSFKTREACTEYVYKLIPLLQARGYMTASIDSMQFDTAVARIQLYTGEIYRWATIDTRKVEPALLSAAGWSDKTFTHRPMNYNQYAVKQQLMLDYLENNGYPFAKISLDNIVIRNGNEVSATLELEKGPLYKVDSIRVYGTARISNQFLQHYLNLPNGTIYRKERLEAISMKILELPYVQEQQPWNLTMVNTGSVVNLYLKPKKSSQINALVGFLPSNNAITGNKLLITGEATVNLKNTLGNGETIGLNWQQLQPSSPRLNLLFQQPYLFNTPFGVNVGFDLFKMDSSYLNVNLQLGVQYALSATRQGSVFIQSMTTSILNFDSATVVNTHTLPAMADISAVSLGVSYDYFNTNYRFNPRKGSELQFVGTVGTKKVKKNAHILKLKDPNDTTFNFGSLYDTVRLNTYEFMVKLAAAHYFPLTRASTLKLAFNGGVFSSPNTYRNELFLIGGYKLLRGFDEASILAAQYTVGTVEYRYLIGVNSFLFTFLDWGWAQNKVPGYNLDNTFLGMGLGLAFETKAGIFNISYALGKRNDANLNFRDSKIHLGYVSFF